MGGSEKGRGPRRKPGEGREGFHSFLHVQGPLCSWLTAALGCRPLSPGRDVHVPAPGLLFPFQRSPLPGLGAPSLRLFHPLLKPRNLLGPEPSRTKPRIQAGNPGVFSHLTRVSINSVPAPANPRTEGKSRLINDQLFQSRLAIIALVAFMITR